jgi:cytochrome P450
MTRLPANHRSGVGAVEDTGPRFQPYTRKEEGLRYDGPIPGPWRRRARDTAIQNFPVRRGDRLFIVHAAANRYPVFYIHRRTARRKYRTTV